MTEHLYTYDDPPSERDLAKMIKILSHDGVMAYPGGSNWAFASDARSAKALDRMYALNPKHPKERPFSLICSSISMAAEYATIDHYAYRMLRKAWPGPFTVLRPSHRTLVRHLKDKRKIVGIRIPNCRMILALVDLLGSPLATTSIPVRAEDDPYRFGYEVAEDYGHAVDLVVDLGNELSGLESTIVDFEDGAPKIIREGVGDPSIFI